MGRKRLEAMVEQATIDCYNEAEQVTGFLRMIEENLAVPFVTQVLGVVVSVDAVDLAEEDQIVVVCSRGRLRQVLPVLELPLSKPPPAGAEWIDAYRFWRTGARS